MHVSGEGVVERAAMLPEFNRLGWCNGGKELLDPTCQKFDTSIFICVFMIET